jgi:hypothetical protein
MPGLNSTGPEGKGPRTGRGLGRCKPTDQEKNENPKSEDRPQAYGRGMGRRSNRGRGTGKGLGRRLGRGNS